MIRTLTIIPALGLLLSCSNVDTAKVLSDSTTVKQQINTPESKAQRQIIIEELKRLQVVVSSKNREQIAGIFEFPISDTTIKIYIDDSSFNAELERNGNRTTKTMFLSFFPQISESLQIEELNQLFKTIRLDSLEQKDILEREVLINTEPCYKYYSVEVQDNIVTLTTGQGVNHNFISSKASKDEVPENSSEFCESVLWWVFKFDGKRLQFIKLHGAG